MAAPHYSISIIRDRGIDRPALAHIAARHDPADAVFVDGWTGKGAIAAELKRSLADAPFGFRPFLAVVADPAGRADLAATDEDYLVPSGLLNAIVSGLVSRTHPQSGAGRARAISTPASTIPNSRPTTSRGRSSTRSTRSPRAPGRPLRRPARRRRRAATARWPELMDRFAIADRNRIKPGIAEATRAVLRRVPERLLLRDPDDPDVRHLVHLAGEKGIEVDRLAPEFPFRAVSLIANMPPG